MNRHLPALMEFHETHAKHRDKFQILAFHGPSGKSFEEIDPHVEKVKAKLWDGKDLPFPILLDATGKTMRELSLTSLGTCVLVDPEGRVIRDGTREQFMREVRAWIEREAAEKAKGEGGAGR